ncbi:LytR/AlgR family response regulator transcription factor [Candidatus Contubernalis alkaliaceticus]|uniref:LytR/AlgR family response regulator transcription factor n=1 Tax=Candidatus Contubernalis alkaliaceticus TaxID=338645 RepID=UPI001F4BF487|nr:LytTR family DNA-binding domain-containing protein [Candidatus Contubernalis alkalaceticus]UNC93148.1 response regulator transcription factor [Candidatus Contubernalis alkalaceticus]
MTLKIVITDDEAGILMVLNNIISTLKGAEIFGEAGTGKDTIELVKRLNPDVVFLDIDLPDIHGIQLAKKLLQIKPELYIVFVTAHINYMWDAIKIYSYDYIVKPINRERVKETIERIQKQLMIENEHNKSIHEVKIPIKDKDSTVFININDIYYLEKAGKKITIHSTRGKFELNKTLKEWEQKLGVSFFRSHKSFIINIRKIEKIETNNRTSYLVSFFDYDYSALLSRNVVHILYDKMQIIK